MTRFLISTCCVLCLWGSSSADDLVREELSQFVATHVGSPRIETPVAGIYVAVGWDLANVAIVHTSAGPVLIDSGSCTASALQLQHALAPYLEEELQALIYTHGDIEQTGGGGIWMGERHMPIWGSASLADEFLEQYIVRQPYQLRRGLRQFGILLDPGVAVPSAWGRPPKLEQLEALPELRLPNRTVDGEEQFFVGDTEFHLWSAPGASPDHLCIWLPDRRTLFVGDNFVNGFPNLSPVRGTIHREPRAWIHSLDRMRSLPIEHLVSSRHSPLSGSEQIQTALRDHRDAIQWIYNQTMRAINEGWTTDELTADLQLPRPLQESPYLAPVVCTPQRACRALYAHLAGWFEERADQLVAPDDAATREIALMGGTQSVLAIAERAIQAGECAWAVHLLAKLRTAHCKAEDPSRLSEEFNTTWATALRRAAHDCNQSDLRSYLLSLADEAGKPSPTLSQWPSPSEHSLQQIPLETFFRSMALRLKAAETEEACESVGLHLRDNGRRFILTIRHGVLEVVPDRPLPGSPGPAVWIITTELDWKRLCLGVLNPTVEMISGRLQIRGSRSALRRFIRAFYPVQEFEQLTHADRFLTASPMQSPSP